MTKMPECPLCGKPITIDWEERTIGSITIMTGCKDCGLVLPFWANMFVFFYDDQEQINQHVIEVWEDVCRRSPYINPAKVENVLRTAYGMPPVTYLDFVERDKLRRKKR